MFDENNQTDVMVEGLPKENGRKKLSRKRKLNENLSASVNLGLSMEMASGLEELLKASEVLSYLSSSNIFPVAQDAGMSANVQPIFQNLTTESARAYLSAAAESIVLTTKGSEITSDYVPAYYQTSKEGMPTIAVGNSDSEGEEPVAKVATKANGKHSSNKTTVENQSRGQKKSGSGQSKSKPTNQINESSRGQSQAQRIGGSPNTGIENEAKRGSTRSTAPALGASALYSLSSPYPPQPLSDPADEPIEFLRKEDLSSKGQYQLPTQLRNTDDMILLPTKPGKN
jgi:hypothetical protein